MSASVFLKSENNLMSDTEISTLLCLNFFSGRTVETENALWQKNLYGSPSRAQKIGLDALLRNEHIPENG